MEGSLFFFVILNGAQRNEESKSFGPIEALDASLSLSIQDADFRRKRLYDKKKSGISIEWLFRIHQHTTN